MSHYISLLSIMLHLFQLFIYLLLLCAVSLDCLEWISSISNPIFLSGSRQSPVTQQSTISRVVRVNLRPRPLSFEWISSISIHIHYFSSGSRSSKSINYCSTGWISLNYLLNYCIGWIYISYSTVCILLDSILIWPPGGSLQSPFIII